MEKLIARDNLQKLLIAEMARQQINLKSLGKLMGVSEGRVKRLFRDHTDPPLTLYIEAAHALGKDVEFKLSD